MDIGSVADWVGAFGGAGGAVSAAWFYFADRRRSQEERHTAEREGEISRKMVTKELEEIAASSLNHLHEMIDNDYITDDKWVEYNGVLQSLRSRLLDLSTVTGDLRLNLAVGRSAHSLAFGNINHSHLNIWKANAQRAIAELEDVTSILKKR